MLKVLISIITPLLNEKEQIRPFFNHLKNLDGEFELILVDGGSTDGTLNEIAKYRKDIKHHSLLLKTLKGRPYQMNVGAENARGDVLLFLHVDCYLHRNGLELIEKKMLTEKIVGGGFKQTFTTDSSLMRIISTFGNLRTRITKTFYGDYGIFIRKDVFKKIKGYNIKSYLEDIWLSNTMKKYGHVIQIDSYIFSSPRKYEKEGKIRLTIIYFLIYLSNILNTNPKQFIRHIS